MALLAEYNFENSDASDAAGVLNGTATNVIFGESSTTDAGIEAVFNGVDSLITTGVRYVTETTVTIPFMAMVTDATGGGYILGQHDGTNGVGVKQTGKKTIRLVVDSTESVDIAVPFGAYFMGVIVLDAGATTLYVGAESESVAAAPTWPTVDLTIGGLAGGSYSQCRFGALWAWDEAAAENEAWNLILKLGDLDSLAPPTATEVDLTSDPDVTIVGGKWDQSNVSYDAVNEAILFDQSPYGNKNGFYVFSSFGYHQSFTAEFELEITNDPGNRDHFGLSLHSDAGAWLPSYRFAVLDRGDPYMATFFTSSQGGGTYTGNYTTENNGDVVLQNDGTKHIWRIVYALGFFWLYVDGVLRLQGEMNEDHKGYGYAPGVHAYSANIDITLAKYWSGAVLPNSNAVAGVFPLATVGSINDYGKPEFSEPNRTFEQRRGHNKFKESPVSIHDFHPITKKLNPVTDYISPLSRSFSRWNDSATMLLKERAPGLTGHVSSVSDQVDGQGSHSVNSTGKRLDPNLRGVIDGYTTDENGLPVSRRVRALDRRNGRIVREAWSNSSGYYRFFDLRTDRTYTIIAHDYKKDYNAVVADDATPELLPDLGALV